MVNPYQPTQVIDDKGDGATPLSLGPTRRPRFLGGLKTVLLIGAISGAAMFGWGIAAGMFFNDPAGPLLGWAVLFFAMNLALISFLRGLELSGWTKLGCAALLTPISMVLFVPVCFGAVIGIATVQSTLPRPMRLSWGFDSASLLVVTIIGFVMIAAMVALMVRRWASIRLARQPSIDIRSSDIQSSDETEDSS